MTPTKRTLWLTVVLLPVALILDATLGEVQWFYLGLLFALVMLSIDGLRLFLSAAPKCERLVDTQVPVQSWVPASLKFTLPEPSKRRIGQRKQCFKVHDLYGDEWQSEGLPQQVELTADADQIVRYRLKATERGLLELPGLHCLEASPWGLWDRRRFISVKQTVRVQPNYKPAMEFALLGDEQRANRFGVRQQRRRGEGTEFQQLREYQLGDPMRKIDWKASSRIGKLISKDFQDEKDQQLVFLLDTGRRMRHKDSETEHMDEALNAMLLLSHVASQQGDAVGFMAFGQDHTWCPPQKHKSIVKHLLDHCFGIRSGLCMSDYLLAAQRLLELQRRRAMVVILTNSRDEDREDLEKALVLLRKKHLVVLVDLHEHFLDAQSEQIQTLDTALTRLSVQSYLNSSREMHASLQRLGSLVVSCTVKALPAKLVTTYHQVKHSGRL